MIFMTTGRSQYFDVLKGMAIFLVVMGHVLTMCVRGIDGAITFRIIGQVHMPLFFFISGWFAWRADGGAPKMRARVPRLLIPMVAVSSLWLLYFPMSGLQSPLPTTFGGMWLDVWKNGYWFTLVLLEIFILYALNFRAFAAMRGIGMQILLAGALWAVLLWLGGLMPAWLAGVLSWELVCDFFPVFMMGVIARRHSDAFNKICRSSTWITVAIVAVVASFMVTGWYWKYPSALVTCCRIVLHISLAVVAIAAVKPWCEAKPASKAVGVWAYVGRKSLAVYLLHYFFLFPMGMFRPFLESMDLAFVPVTLFAAAWAAVIVAVTLGVEYLLSFSKPLSYILTGNTEIRSATDGK